MSDKPAGKSDATSMKLEVANSDPETARQRGLKSFDWRAEVAKHSRINKEQVRLLSPPWRGPAVQNASPRMERMRQPVFHTRILNLLESARHLGHLQLSILARLILNGYFQDLCHAQYPRGLREEGRRSPELYQPSAFQLQSRNRAKCPHSHWNEFRHAQSLNQKLPTATRMGPWKIQSRMSQKFSGLEEGGAKEFGSKG